MKNDFINNMTHEFKTPISSISLAAQMLSDQSIKKSEAMYENLSRVINDETKRLRFQVEKVLQMSLYDRDNIAFKQKELDAHQLLAGVIKTFTLKVSQNGGSISSDFKAEQAEIYVDEMHFTNVIFNLMDNAVKYKRDDVELHLTLRTWNTGDKINISIEDNGIGIQKDDLKRIFDKFYRVHTGNKHDVKGFGLGLAYVKKIVGLQNGVIHAESEYGSWNEIYNHITNNKKIRIMEEKLRILLCEDDESLGMLLREYLQAKGYEAELFPDGDAGYKAFLKNRYEMCVLDVMMPKKDGFQLAQEIRQVNAEIPIIFLTAKNLKEDIFDGFKIGADDYITKPFSMEELVFRMEAILRRVRGKKVKETNMYKLGRFTFDTQRQILAIGDKQTS